MEDEIQNEADRLKAIAPGEAERIPYYLVTNKGSKFSQLLLSDDEGSSYKLENREYRLKFSSVIFVDKVVIEFEGTLAKTAKDRLSVIAIDPFDKKETFKTSVSGENRLVADVSSVVKELDFKVVKKLLSKDVRVKELHIYGWYKGNLSDFAQSASEVLRAKRNIEQYVQNQLNKIAAEVNQAKQKKAQFEQETEELSARKREAEEELAGVAEELGNLKAERDEFQNQVEAISDECSQLEHKADQLGKKIDSQEDILEQREKSRRELTERVSDLHKELAELQNDKSLFTDEIAEYARRGDRDSRMYLLLAFLPIVILSFMAWRLYENSEFGVNFHELGTGISVGEYLLARLPYVVVSVAIIEVSFRVCMHFVKRLIHIHQDRLDLARISIIARDVSDSSLQGLDVTEEEAFDLRAKLKMDVLKSHLANHIGHDYEYGGEESVLTRLKQRFGPLAERFQKRKDTRAPEVEESTEAGD